MLIYQLSNCCASVRRRGEKRKDKDSEGFFAPLRMTNGGERKESGMMAGGTRY
jgi:hypothetical protein